MCILVQVVREGELLEQYTYVKASSSITRHVLQQLESVKVLEQDDDNG